MFQAKPILEQRSQTTIIKRVLSGQVSSEQAKVDETISPRMIRNWITKYQDGGEVNLVNK